MSGPKSGERSTKEGQDYGSIMRNKLRKRKKRKQIVRMMKRKA